MAKLKSRKFVLCGIALLLSIAGILHPPAIAQRQREEYQRLMEDLATNRQPPEGSEFIFARVQYTTVRAARGYRSRGLEGWAHDYPEAEEHILQIANEATGINLQKMSYVIVRLDSEEIFKYPYLYFSEVGEMYLNEKEISNFREWLNRGGFAIVDDFDSQESLDWFQSQMRQVFPDRSFVQLKVDNPIFHTYYDMPTLKTEPPYEQRTGGKPKYYGYFDDKGRLCMILNHDNDLGDFWEWIDQPMYALGPSAEGLRFGVDYFLYSMTH